MLRLLTSAATMKGLVEGAGHSRRDQDWFLGAESLFALALFGFGLLFLEFEFLVLDVDLPQVELRVEQLEVEFGLFFEALAQCGGVEAIQNGEHFHGGDVHGRLEEDVRRMRGHGPGVFQLEFEIVECVREGFRVRGFWFRVFQHGGHGGHGVHRGRVDGWIPG